MEALDYKANVLDFSICEALGTWNVQWDALPDHNHKKINEMIATWFDLLHFNLLLNTTIRMSTESMKQIVRKGHTKTHYVRNMRIAANEILAEHVRDQVEGCHYTGNLITKRTSDEDFLKQQFLTDLEYSYGDTIQYFEDCL